MTNTKRYTFKGTATTVNSFASTEEMFAAAAAYRLTLKRAYVHTYSNGMSFRTAAYGRKSLVIFDVAGQDMGEILSTS